MRSLLTIALSLFAASSSAADQPARRAYLIVVTSPKPEIIQSLTAVAYGSREECENGLRLMAIKDTTPTKVKVTVAPYCTDKKPAFWPD